MGGLSRRVSKRILNFIFAEMNQALARDEPVEFPLGYLERREKDSPFFKWDGDPLQPYTVQHVLDGEGDWLLNPAGWSSRPLKLPCRRMSGRADLAAGRTKKRMRVHA